MIGSVVFKATFKVLEQEVPWWFTWGSPAIHLDVDTRTRFKQDRYTHKQPRGVGGLNKHTALGFQWLYADIPIFKYIYSIRWMQRC